MMTPRRIVYAIVCAVIAHLLASYLCLYVTLERIADVQASATAPSKIYIDHSYKVYAPLHIFQILQGWRATGQDGAKGVLVLWLAYLVPFVLVLAGLVMAPKWLFVEDAQDARGQVRR